MRPPYVVKLPTVEGNVIFITVSTSQKGAFQTHLINFKKMKPSLNNFCGGIKCLEDVEQNQ